MDLFVAFYSGVAFLFPPLRESEPNSWEDALKDELDRTKYPRMPWHDVHFALWGPPCRDIARHFVQRWNYAKVDISVECGEILEWLLIGIPFSPQIKEINALKFDLWFSN